VVSHQFRKVFIELVNIILHGQLSSVKETNSTDTKKPDSQSG
jgi:hypothetical protein